MASRELAFTQQKGQKTSRPLNCGREGTPTCAVTTQKTLGLRTRFVDKAEALQILRSYLEPYRNRKYADLAALVGQEPVTRDVTAASGARYQLEIQAIWDDGPGGDVRVIGSVDDGGWRSFAPLGDDFIMAPDGSFVGEGSSSA